MTRRTALLLVLSSPLGKPMPQEEKESTYSGNIIVNGLFAPMRKWGITFPDSLEIFTVRIGGKSFEIPVQDIVKALEEK